MPVPSNITDLSTTAGSNSPAGNESIGTNLDDYLRAAFAFIKQINDTAGAPRVLGLVGNVNAVTPLTKFDLSATSVVMRNSTGGVVARHNTGTLTCDLGLVGSAANGRDQAAAFTANSWVYLYFIWNGTTLATLASTTAPASFTGSTLPSGYTHWAFATTIRWNASSNIVKARAIGRTVWYDVDQAGGTLSGGTSTVYAAVSLASWVPPITLLATLGLSFSLSPSTNGVSSSYIRSTGGAAANGMLGPQLTAVAPASAAGFLHSNTGTVTLQPGTSQQIDYKISYAGSPTLINFSIDVLNYTIPNGDA